MYKNRSEMLNNKLKESKDLSTHLESVYNTKINKLQKEFEECENEKQQLLLQIKGTEEGNPVSEPNLSNKQLTSNQNVKLINFFFYYYYNYNYIY